MKVLIQPELLRDWMEMRQMNGAQLGRLAGTSRQFIHQLRTGRRTSCNATTAAAIEIALRTGVGGLFREADGYDMQPLAVKTKTRQRSRAA